MMQAVIRSIPRSRVLAIVIPTTLILAVMVLSTVDSRWPAYRARTEGRAAKAHVPTSPGIAPLYIDTVKKSVAGVLLKTPSIQPERISQAFDAAKRTKGEDWPQYGMTMIGMLRLDNLQFLLQKVIAQRIPGVPGDFVECGVWRGGASIFARAILAAAGIHDRRVQVVDSFQGLPMNTTKEDNRSWFDFGPYLSVSQREVEDNFMAYGLLDDQVVFHPGYFRYSLPAWRQRGGGAIAVLRMDGDMYESTMDIFYNLWDHVAVGGWVIVDEYPLLLDCKRAVDEFRARNHISSELQLVDGMDGHGAYFQKTAAGPIDRTWYLAFNASRTADDMKHQPDNA